MLVVRPNLLKFLDFLPLACARISQLLLVHRQIASRAHESSTAGVDRCRERAKERLKQSAYFQLLGNARKCPFCFSAGNCFRLEHSAFTKEPSRTRYKTPSTIVCQVCPSRPLLSYAAAPPVFSFLVSTPSRFR